MRIISQPDRHEPEAELASKLAALAHPARIEILRQLSLHGCCCCKDVVDSVDLAQSTVSQHLKVLVSAGLVHYATDRRRSLYRIDRDAAAPDLWVAPVRRMVRRSETHG